MRKFLLYIFSFLTAASLLVAPAYAETEIKTCPEDAENFGKLCKLSEGNLGNIVSTVVTVLLIVAVLIALFFLVWGGIRWILSGGDKGGVENARNMIIAAIVGLIIAFLAYFILNIVLGFFGLSLGALELPKLDIAN